MIKGMISQYNKAINEIDKYYGADSARKYSMLTDEEKEAMKDKVNCDTGIKIIREKRSVGENNQI